ncbi:Holliday junction branch migration protein RuvA [Alloscardovia criceti]|uniref:Holliday junction branch migration protein RuvA n=1 Tax=Alloscardovia criceti TaxID=356828 RepID=UPI000370B9E4|nr:Holliday junction branch migration protein RuvA [Alloscardovia criceti]
MIASLHGVVEAVTTSQAIVEVAGVGYSVRMSAKDLNQMRTGQEVRVLTTMTVSQDAISLYGFLHKTSQELFAQLQKVSGIGPRVALAILSTLSSDELVQAIRDNNLTALTKAPGLGKKGAQKIILELSGAVNLESLLSSDSQEDRTSTHPADGFADEGSRQVLQGLMSLGWQQRDAYEAVRFAMTELDLGNSVELDKVPQVLRFALSHLDRGR